MYRLRKEPIPLVVYKQILQVHGREGAGNYTLCAWRVAVSVMGPISVRSTSGVWQSIWIANMTASLHMAVRGQKEATGLTLRFAIPWPEHLL